MRRLSLAFGCIYLLFGSTALSAAPFLYTFTGNIEYIEVDGAYLSDIDFDNDYSTSEDSFKVGDLMEYTFLVDFDLPGFCAGPLGTTYSSTCSGIDIPDSGTADYFFSDLVSATRIAPATEEGTTFNYGLSLANLGWLTADSAIFVVSPYNEPVNKWVATSATGSGTLLIGTDAWAAPNGNSPYGRINSALTLTSITPVTNDDCKKHKKNTDKGAWARKILGRQVTSTADPKENLIINPGFESGNKNSWVVRGKARARIVQETVGDSDYSLALYGNPDCYRSVSQFIKDAIIPGELYFFSGNLAVEGRTQGKYLLQVRWYDQNAREIKNSRTNFGYTKADVDYVTHEIELIAPDRASSVSLHLKANKADGAGYFDEIVIRESGL